MAVACPITFRTSGIEILDPFLDHDAVTALCDLCEPLLDRSDRRRPGVRRVLQKEPRILDVLRASPVWDLIREVGGPGGRIVRAILFDKSPESNWLVPWHQDASIAVAERLDVPGFGPWAVKDGEHHCQPPADVLASIFTIRVHLDPCAADSGPLRVIVGSHLQGLLDDDAMAGCVRDGESIEAVSGRGAIVLTTPLAVHSSPKSVNPAARRRVLHLDCTPIQLPGGLRFAEAP
ncbi:MAG TPA: phytanoyl-CoA dioxygenase family protein [Phycisphaerales bacterium]|nr:phytanoyl-CoA dioxygenase family protein [Phycisphaerales bacterium]